MRTPYTLASRTRRFQARLWDWVYCWTPGVFGCLALNVAIFSDLHVSDATLSVFALGFLASLVLLLMNLVHFVRTGQSWGKKRMGLLVINVSGDRMTGGGLVWRCLAPTVAAMVPFFGLIMYFDCFFIFSESRRCLHDHLASSQVVDASSYEEPGPLGTGLNPSEIGFSTFS
ncbi:MAG: RDD family protein [Candidatus Eremiobacteraeota bacterium]|nr:RDD family protein [Candidatus Eremiobacteraeota bacterium]